MLSRTRIVVVGIQPNIVKLLSGSNSARSALVARRLLSTSTCSHAEHSNHSHRPQTPASLVSGIEYRKVHKDHPSTQYDSYGHEIDPYKNGPGALDKAVHLFFFTEIIRGAYLG